MKTIYLQYFMAKENKKKKKINLFIYFILLKVLAKQL